MSFDLLGGNPAPGSPVGIRSLADAIDVTSQAALSAADELSGITHSTASMPWRGESAERFAETLGPLPAYLRSMSTSYTSVARQLDRYATTLEELQVEAAQAVQRAELASERQQEADGSHAAAVSRLSTLSRELSDARSETHALQLHYQVQAAASDPSAVNTYQQYTHAAQWYADLSSSYEQTQTDMHAASRASADAGDDLASARNWAHDIAGRRSDAEAIAATMIRASLAADLKNASLVGQALHAAGHLIGDAVKGVEAVGRDIAIGLKDIAIALAPLAAALHDLIKPIADFVSKHATAFLVIGIVCALLLPGVGEAIAGAMLAMHSLQFAADLIMWQAKYPDPETGELVTGGEVLGDGIETAADVVAWDINLDDSQFEPDALFIQQETSVEVSSTTQMYGNLMRSDVSVEVSQETEVVVVGHMAPVWQNRIVHAAVDPLLDRTKDRVKAGLGVDGQSHGSDSSGGSAW